MLCMGNEFSTWLDKEIQERGINYSEFARRAGIGRATLSKILSYDKDSKPKADTVSKIAKGLNLPVDFVFIKAEILPPDYAKDKINPTLEEANRLLSELPEEYQRQALQLVRFLHDNHAPPNLKKAESTTK